MIINKLVKQKMDVVKTTLPDLYSSVNAHFPELSDEQKGKLAGFVIEYVIKSGGNPDVFQDELLGSTEELEEDGAPDILDFIG